MELTTFKTFMVFGLLCGIAADVWISAIHQKEYNEKVPKSVHMLIIFGSVLLSIPIAGVAIVLIRVLGAI